MILISIGQGNRNPKADVADVDIAAFLTTNPPAEEAWWSGHLWDGNYRKAEKWIATTAIILDVDHHGKGTDPKRRHTAPSAERKQEIDIAGLPGTCWHHTPRGVRVVFALTEPCDNAEQLERATRGAASMVTRVLREAGVLAARDKAGRPFDGYAVDEATFDRARLFYTPNAIVNDVQRADTVNGGGASFDIKTLEAECKEKGHSAPMMETIDVNEISDKLARMPCDGANDGSLELMRCARKAFSLGAHDLPTFLTVVARWNDRRSVPWREPELTKRFADVSSRWEADGLAKVPMGKYMRGSIDVILRTDGLYAGKLEWDELDQCVRWGGVPFRDVDITHIEHDVCARYKFPVISREAVFNSVVAVAQENVRNRVTEYLASVDWDGVDRREAFARAFDVAPDKLELAAEYLWRWRIAACARAARPGCKHDHILVFVGPEAARKSTAFRVLAGDDNFSDTYIDIESKDAYQQIQRAWIIEWSEIESITRRSDVARLKAFMSSCEDSYRAPYGKVVEKHPRRCAFVSSSNSHDIITDKHSNRRFWILETGPRIDLEWIKTNRDQIWAEAVYGLANDEPWWLTEDFEQKRVEVNADYTPDDPVSYQMAVAVDALDKLEPDKKKISAHELYIKLGLDISRASAFLRSTIATEMMKKGYVRKHTKKGTVYVQKEVLENSESKVPNAVASPDAAGEAASDTIPSR